MPSKIDQNLIPPVIKDSVDPDILNRARSIEWSIDRDTGENERGFLDGSHEDYLSGQNLMQKSHRQLYSSPAEQLRAQQKARNIEWFDNNNGRDSGYDRTPTSPSLGGTGRNFGASTGSLRSGSNLSGQTAAMGPLDESLDELTIGNTNSVGRMKRHPQGQHPFPIYQVNQSQLEGDVVFEVAPRARPGERTVHYEKSTRVVNEEELNALGLDPNFFGPNSKTTMDEQEEETIESSRLNGGSRELEALYNSMRGDAGDYFDRQRARSVSPDRQNPIESESSQMKRTVLFSSVDDLSNRDQEYYPYRDANQGKPLPGDNEYGTWGSRYDDKRQWKLCNGQWVRVADPKPEPEPKHEKYLAERVKCKPPKNIAVARSEPVKKVEPDSGSTDNSDLDSDYYDDDDDDDNPVRVIKMPASSSPEPEPVHLDVDLEPIPAPKRPIRPVERAATTPASAARPIGQQSPPIVADRRRKSPPLVDAKPDDDDLEALRDKYRPKGPKPADYANDTNAKPKPSGTILLEPIEPPLEEIKVEPILPTYVEMKKPLKKPEGEEEKMMEDPNLMWMHMGPAQYGPPFGSMKRRKAREEEWIGPPCELCHKQIEERRCMLAENMKFHCWHFACSFCLKTLKPADFLIAEADRKPYCLNCHKREFPEISLVGLKLDQDQ